MHFTPLHILRPVLLLALLMLPGAVFDGGLRAQERVNILEAESLVEESVGGEPVQKILGRVHLRMGDLEMYCDSAYRYLQRDEVRAYGNIEIITGEERIWADTLAYFTDIDFSQLRGRVVIVSDSTTLFGRSVDYRFSTRVGHFLDGVRLEDPQGVLRASSGFYYREADSAVFRGEVQLADSAQYLEGDSLFSNRSSESYRLYGDIYARDEDNRSTLKGNYLEADSTGRRLLRGNAWLRRVSVDTAEADTGFARRPDPIPRDSSGRAGGDSLAVRKDTTHIRARKIVMRRAAREADSAATVNATDSVRIWSPRFSSLSDSARYDDGREIFELRAGPLAWYDNIQLSGPYIRAELEEGVLSRLVSRPRPFVVQQDTALDRLNQITGDTLTAYFREGDLARIWVVGNTRLLRFMQNAAGEADGAVEISSGETRIVFEQGRLEQVKHLGSPSGFRLEESEKTSGRRLDGFRWDPGLRPTRPEGAMEPRFDPIPDGRPFELPPRYRRYLDRGKQRN